MEALKQTMAVNAERVARMGAQVVVMSKLLDATLPHLTPLQRVEIEKAFRDGIEDAMACADDIAMPGQYHVTLLELTNLFLATLNADRQDAC
ncbi:hypothetical protein FAZ69_18365 [Trinickia terrae]|uniref:Uncharacterized protein n=1 Tax=Trinickia terrae TaxID=2571161 RepID=A0A4U1I290_9BURK|nr:hypothetical protein [Trinickia terrae]TKC87296.1 hypothetical protein FAZ69_18365 [Trinickia terrae]